MPDKKFNLSYVGERPDIEKLISPQAKMILDVGCSTGVLGSSLKANTGAYVVGIEISPSMAEIAEKKIDKVLCGDVTEIFKKGQLKEQSFDTIIFADVLEHLEDPWITLQYAVKCLKPEGKVVASIPNVRHIDTLFHLIVKGYWPYRNRGIHDRTHLRFFTLKNIHELFESANLSIDMVRPNYRLIERPHKLNEIAKYIALPGIKGFIAFQYIVRANLKGIGYLINR